MRSGGWKKFKKSINVEGGNVRGGWKKFKINKCPRLLRDKTTHLNDSTNLCRAKHFWQPKDKRYYTTFQCGRYYTLKENTFCMPLKA